MQEAEKTSETAKNLNICIERILYTLNALEAVGKDAARHLAADEFETRIQSNNATIDRVFIKRAMAGIVSLYLGLEEFHDEIDADDLGMHYNCTPEPYDKKAITKSSGYKLLELGLSNLTMMAEVLKQKVPLEEVEKIIPELVDVTSDKAPTAKVIQEDIYNSAKKFESECQQLIIKFKRIFKQIKGDETLTDIANTVRPLQDQSCQHHHIVSQ